MTQAEMDTAFDAVVSAFTLVTDLVFGNVEIVFAVATVMALVGLFMFMVKSLYRAVGMK